MDVLSSETLTDAFNFCSQNPDVRVWLACSTRRTANELINSIQEAIDTDCMPGWVMWNEIPGRGRAALICYLQPEPSFIEIFVRDVNNETAVAAVGCDRVLYDAYMSDPEIQRLALAERPELPGKEESRTELDEFLNSFKII